MAVNNTMSTVLVERKRKRKGKLEPQCRKFRHTNKARADSRVRKSFLTVLRHSNTQETKTAVIQSHSLDLRMTEHDLLHQEVFSETFLEQQLKRPTCQTIDTPYSHVVAKDVFNDSFLRRCLLELKTSLSANFKETDLFKVYQTIDLANLEEQVIDPYSQVPSLIQLRETLYSQDFKSYVSIATGCGLLDGPVDCSCNIYTPGCHLLCHDDVIGTRRVSYILYLSEPEEGWSVDDGGQLELYDMAEDGVNPRTNPSASILPSWNSCVMFEVLPGQSFHAVREVTSRTKTRVSISGWFHTMNDDERRSRIATMSTLQQLKAGYGIVSSAPSACLPRNVRENCRNKCTVDLREWINPEYLDKDSMIKIKKCISNDGSVVLHQFFLPEVIRAMASVFNREDRKIVRGGIHYDNGCANGWHVIGPPHVNRYLVYSCPENYQERSEAGEMLEEIRREVFVSIEFCLWLSAIFGRSVTYKRSQSRRFRPGLDYTLAFNGNCPQIDELDVTACFAAGNEPLTWLTGDVGGFTCFDRQMSHKDEGPADVYETTSPDSTLTSVSPVFNSLSIVRIDGKTSSFVKFVSAFASGSRWDVTSRFVS